MRCLAINRAASAALLAVAFGSPWVAVADTATGYQLNPRVRPGDVVIQRRVEGAPINRVKRHGGPITSRVNVRETVQGRLQGIDAVSLTDERAAGIRGSVQSSLGSLNRTLGTDNQLVRGGASGGDSNRAASSLGGGSGGGGSISSKVTSATSRMSGTVGRALAPLTGKD